MPAKRSRDFQEVLDAAKQQGWVATETGRGHFQFRSPNGKDLVTAGGDYGDYRAIKNLVTRLKKGGFVPPNRYR